VEVRTLHTNIAIVITKFIYDHIFSQFGYPLTVVTDQGTHFIDNVTHYSTNHFILKHINYIIYYPQGNEQADQIY